MSLNKPILKNLVNMENQSKSIYLSVVLPVYNEVESLPMLHEALCNELQAIGLSYEILYCDDGSRDGSADVLLRIRQQ